MILDVRPNKLKGDISKKNMLVSFVILVILKQVLALTIPIFANAMAPHDDGMMVSMAENLSHGNWLGTYSQLTLVKGIVFPLFLAVTHFLGIPYIFATILIYSAACVFFILAIQNIFRSRIGMIIVFVLLLFNPVSFAMETLSRVYRNGLTMSQVLFLIGSFTYLYLHKANNSPRNVIVSLIGGISLASMWNTREDAIWIIPFVLAATGVLIGHELKRRSAVLNKVKRITLFLVPLLTLFIVNNTISYINYRYYGIFTTNEINNSSFTDAMKSIYSVKPLTDLPYVSVPREKIERLYSVSPTLLSIGDQLEPSLDNWSIYDRHPKDREVEDGFFFWCLRDAAAAAGYHRDAKTAEIFYQKIADEITAAAQDHLLETQHTMPSALMSPWRDGYLRWLITTFLKANRFVGTFSDVAVHIPPSIDDGKYGIKRFEAITNNNAVHQVSEYRISGWYRNFQFKNSEIYLYLKSEKGDRIQQLAFQPSADVYNYFKTHGTDDKGYKNIRFQTTLAVEDFTKIVLAAEDLNGNTIDTIVLDGSTMSGNSEKSQFFLDEVQKTIIQNRNFPYYSDRLYAIVLLYQIGGKVLGMLGLFSFVALTVLLAATRSVAVFDTLLIMAGLLGSYTVLVFGVSFNEIASCFSINYLYLSGAYPLYLAFTSIGVIKLVEECCKRCLFTRGDN